MITPVEGIQAAISFNEKIADEKISLRMIEDIVHATKELIIQRCPVDTGKLKSTICSVRTGDVYVIMVGDESTPYVVPMEYGFSGFNIGTIENPKFMKSGVHPFIRSSVWEINKKNKSYIKRALFN